MQDIFRREQRSGGGAVYSGNLPLQEKGKRPALPIFVGLAVVLCGALRPVGTFGNRWYLALWPDKVVVGVAFGSFRH